MTFIPSGDVSQKNWIPFQYKGKLLYIQHINPLIVVEIPYSGDKINSNNNSDAKIVHKLDKIHIPFPYGDLRGGTPALLVEHHGVFISFFHTKTNAQLPFKQSTYFFGAITFCHLPPFNIRAVSPQPIVNDSLYKGPWLWPSLDYVVYPSGILIENDEITKRPHVLVSVGHQDRNAYMFKFDLHGLLKSLQIVGNCSR
jgi:hypothetical protein